MANSRREKELARQRAERQAARRAEAEAKRKQRNAIVASVLAIALVAGAAVSLALATRSGDDTLAAPNPVASAKPSTGPAVAPGDCAYTPTGLQPARPAPVPPTTDVEDEQVYTVTLATSQGEIGFEADSAAAPCTVNSFRSLAEAGYFDDTACHRLTTAGISVLQCGDPSATGGGDPGYKFPDENLDGATYPRGTVAMANSGPDTNGSQFFLVYADSSLPPSYTPFGTLSAASLEVLDKVAAGGVAPGPKPSDGKPAIPVQIQKATVAPKA